VLALALGSSVVEVMAALERLLGGHTGPWGLPPSRQERIDGTSARP